MIKVLPQGISIRLHIQPNSSRNQIVGQHGDRIKIKLATPPVDGKANETLIRFLADIFNLNLSKVTITHGLTSRQKTVFIQDITLELVEQKLL